MFCNFIRKLIFLIADLMSSFCIIWIFSNTVTSKSRKYVQYSYVATVCAKSAVCAGRHQLWVKGVTNWGGQVEQTWVFACCCLLAMLQIKRHRCFLSLAESKCVVGKRDLLALTWFKRASWLARTDWQRCLYPCFVLFLAVYSASTLSSHATTLKKPASISFEIWRE